MEATNNIIAKLCTCNKCGNILIDENPSDQPPLTVSEKIADYMERDGQNYPVCPVCLSDENLMDIENDDHLQRIISSHDKERNC